MNNQKNPFGKQDEESDREEINTYSLDLEFKLCKLVSFLRKQGYPIDNSFVSYYSVDFQVQINCGPDPISKAVCLTPTDLEVNRNGESSLQLIFARGIKGDFYDTEINQ
jgi:hypothetical protein